MLPLHQLKIICLPVEGYIRYLQRLPPLVLCAQVKLHFSSLHFHLLSTLLFFEDKFICWREKLSILRCIFVTAAAAAAEAESLLWRFCCLCNFSRLE